MKDFLTMGTRGSPLALAQSRQIARALEREHPGLHVQERIIRTTGDKQQSASLPAIGGKGVFTLEIEAALLNGEIDFAVHSLKDLPPLLPQGLCIDAIPRRESASDVCVLRPDLKAETHESALPFLPLQARVGTSSLRRKAQLLHLRPDLQISDVRGNIDTRLKKLEAQFDAIILARAGLNRLGVELEGRDFPLDDREFVPAPGQGALAIQARADDDETLQLLGVLEHADTRDQVMAERTTMRALNAGCSTPLGARAITQSGLLMLWAAVLSPDGARRIFAEDAGSQEDAELIGENVAELLMQQGATELLTADE